MIVKFLDNAKSFGGIVYNLNKILANKGEIMKVSGFGTLQNFGILRPEDYCLYLDALAGFNGRVRKPQLHVVVSAEAKEHSKKELTRIAIQWMEEMGYGSQPYLIALHRDTDNAHVHIVSCRVNRDGKKIPSDFERVRSRQALDRIMGEDTAHKAMRDAGKALGYRFSTVAQLRLLLENMGYRPKEMPDGLGMYRSGALQYMVKQPRIDQKLSEYTADKSRAKQLKAILHKYRQQYDATPVREQITLPGGRTKVGTGLRSELGDFLHDKLALELIFHAAGEKEPYGYTIIDHDAKIVFKGSEIMRLSELLGAAPAAGTYVRTTGESGKRQSSTPTFRPYFTNDIDDQQIHGQRRRRQKKARTNTR